MDLVFEKDFLKTIIYDFKKLLAFRDEGLYSNLHFQETYEANVRAGEVYTLSKTGTMMYYYYLVYNERYPKEPTIEQQRRINEIWIAMKMPENVVPV